MRMANLTEAAGEVTDAAATEDFHPSSTILDGLKVYGVIGVVAWLFFDLVARRRLARAYHCRDRSDETRSPQVALARASRTFAWVWPLLSASDDEVFARCGLDTLCLLRFLRMCEKIAAVAVLLSAANFPVYYLAQSDDDDPLYRMTLSHLTTEGDGIYRFWATVGTMYVVAAVTCFLLWREYVEYVRRRHEFMGRLNAQQYSIVLDGLPQHLRTQQTLRNFLELLFPRSVVHVYVALECGDLEKLVAERVKVRDRLEHALARSALTGDRVLVKAPNAGLCGKDKADAIELYQEQLASLNKAVEMEVRAILRNQAALAQQVLEQSTRDDAAALGLPPVSSASPAPTGLRQRNTATNSSGSSVHIPTLQAGAADDDCDVIVPDKYYDLAEDDAAQAESQYIRGLRKQQKTKERADGGIASTGIMRGAGFVTFNSLKAAQSAQQILQSSDPTEMQIEAAAHVDDIVWENLGVSANVKSTWVLVSLGISGAIILFWTIPTGLAVSFAKVSSLKNDWPWLATVLDDNTWLVPVFEQLSPLMLSVMAALAPIIFGFLSKREGHASGAQVGASLLNKLVVYQVYVTFLLPIIGGTVIDAVTGSGDTDLTDIKALLTTVSDAVPVQSSFFVSYILVQMGLNLSLQLLRVTPIVKAAIYQLLAPKLTPRERTSPWFGLSPLDVPGDYSAADDVASYYLILMLVLVFCAVAPILNYFALLYLLLADLVTRWAVLCVADPSPHSVGAFFPSLYRFCIGALLFAQIIMASLLATKQAALPATFAIILPFLTLVFHLFVHSRYPRTAMNLPLDQCVLLDAQRAREIGDRLPERLDDMYKQPAMAERAPLEPDYHALGSDPHPEHQLSSPPAEV